MDLIAFDRFYAIQRVNMAEYDDRLGSFMPIYTISRLTIFYIGLTYFPKFAPQPGHYHNDKSPENGDFRYFTSVIKIRISSLLEYAE